MSHAPTKLPQSSSIRIPFKTGFLTDDLSDLGSVRLIGSRCRDCRIVLLGRRRRCENCSGKDLLDETFSSFGKVYSFTIQRYAPPMPHAFPGAWHPRPIAWVDLDDNGPRILSPVACDPEKMHIGMAVHLVCGIGWFEDDGREAIAYTFESIDGCSGGKRQ